MLLPKKCGAEVKILEVILYRNHFPKRKTVVQRVPPQAGEREDFAFMLQDLVLQGWSLNRTYHAAEPIRRINIPKIFA